METIAAAKFKEQCLKLLEEVGPEGLLITKHGKPIARLMPVDEPHAKMIGQFKTKLVIHGDVSSTGLEWNAES